MESAPRADPHHARSAQARACSPRPRRGVPRRRWQRSSARQASRATLRQAQPPSRTPRGRERDTGQLAPNRRAGRTSGPFPVVCVARSVAEPPASSAQLCRDRESQAHGAGKDPRREKHRPARPDADRRFRQRQGRRSAAPRERPVDDLSTCRAKSFRSLGLCWRLFLGLGQRLCISSPPRRAPFRLVSAARRTLTSWASLVPSPAVAEVVARPTTPSGCQPPVSRNSHPVPQRRDRGA